MLRINRFQKSVYVPFVAMIDFLFHFLRTKIYRSGKKKLIVEEIGH